jgi:hypothetical protein
VWYAFRVPFRLVAGWIKTLLAYVPTLYAHVEH